MAAFKILDGVDPQLGEEICRVDGSSPDEYTLTMRFFPHDDLKIGANVDIDFFVSPTLREKGGVQVILRDKTVEQYIAPEFISMQEDGKPNVLNLPWMVKVRYSVPVWFFAVRNLLRKESVEPWRASVLVESEFRNFPDSNGTGINSGRNLSAKLSSIADESMNVSLIIGTACNRGKRPYMEDVDFVEETVPIDSRSISVFGVLDGHGGQDCAIHVKEDFPSMLVKLLRNRLPCAEALFRAFQDVDEEYIRQSYGSNAGSTANISLFDRYSRRLYVANTGDTRAVLSRNGTAINVSYDRKASDPEEIARIVRAGGFIINNRVLGSLAVSRAFGDIPLKSNRNVLLVDPEITSVDLSVASSTRVNNFLVVATDGLWDVMSSQEVVDYVREELCKENILESEPPFHCKLSLPALTPRNKVDLQRQLSSIATSLVTKAIQELNSMDNVTVLIVLIVTDDVNQITGININKEQDLKFDSGKVFQNLMVSKQNSSESNYLVNSIDIPANMSNINKFSNSFDIKNPVANIKNNLKPAEVDDDEWDFLKNDINFKN